jgi:hypothetical protein
MDKTRYYNSSCTLLNTVDNDAQSYRWQDVRAQDLVCFVLVSDRA